MKKEEFHLSREQIDKSKKRLFWYLISVILLFAIIIFYYFQNAKLQNEKVEINKTNEKNLLKLSTLKNKTYATIDTLKRIINKQEKLIDSMAGELNSTPSTPKNVSRIDPVKKLNKQLTSISNSRYLISLQSYKIPKPERTKIYNFLKKSGYTNIEGYTHDNEDEKPDWMSDSPTVFYYSATSKKKAMSIAKEISAITRKKYKISLGKDPGVIKGQEAYTFFVHNVAN